ncbi:aldehyde dehydrogenase family protein [Cobetia marina]|uniref:aldehyde dehydrogenase family protein n=1 Tax=Cobetia marina TaxID=28258 RepID=UPI0010AEA1A4|nr:aldehyde dehydrogenase family protein [Cobetia marina]TKD62679.1 aldehyde dehydrogenase family protein [Cobetia marina]
MDNEFTSFQQLYIGGEWTSSHGNRFIEVINPATEEVIGTVPEGTVEDVDHAVQAARAALPSWSATSASLRSMYIKRLVEEMKSQQELMAFTITSELGMPLHLSHDIQVVGPIEGLETHIDIPHRLNEEKIVGNSIIFNEAIGVCSLICPWNYPLHQLIGKVAPALAAGCTMVVKPATETPLNAFLLARMIDNIGLPAGVFNLITGPGATVGEAMCQHPEVDLVSFTGSTRAGIHIAKSAANTVKRVCQELGGKSPLIITKEANIEAAVTFGVQDVMLNSGQTCTALTRMLVPVSCYDEVLSHAKNAVKEISFGDPLDTRNYMGPMSSKKQQEIVLDYIERGIEEGATLLTGGTDNPLGKGFYVRPTIFADVDNSMSIAQEEIFGPVLCIIPYETLEDAIEMANDSPFGLSAAVWGESQQQALDIAKKVKAGQVYINGADFNYQAPFGGVKQSGNGREWGITGAMEYIELKSVQV